MNRITNKLLRCALEAMAAGFVLTGCRVERIQTGNVNPAQTGNADSYYQMAYADIVANNWDAAYEALLASNDPRAPYLELIVLSKTFRQDDGDAISQQMIQLAYKSRDLSLSPPYSAAVSDVALWCVAHYAGTQYYLCETKPPLAGGGAVAPGANPFADNCAPNTKDVDLLQVIAAEEKDIPQILEDFGFTRDDLQAEFNNPSQPPPSLPLPPIP